MMIIPWKRVVIFIAIISLFDILTINAVEFQSSNSNSNAAYATLYERCVTNCDCRTKYTVCTTSPMGCGTNPQRYCQCADGYRADTDLQCRQEAHLGQKCGNDFICVDELTLCNRTSNRCECGIGFKKTQGQRPRCVPVWVTANFGESCGSPLDCDITQDCIDGRCVCAPGYSYSETARTCIDSQLGDECTYDIDCSAVNNAACTSGKCTCLAGFQSRLVSLRGKNVRLCLRENAPAGAKEGQFCNEPPLLIPSRAISYCQPNLTCTVCPGYVFSPLERVCASTSVPPSCIVPRISNGRVAVSMKTRTDVVPVRVAMFAEVVCDAGFSVVNGADSSFCDEISDLASKLGQCQ